MDRSFKQLTTAALLALTLSAAGHAGAQGMMGPMMGPMMGDDDMGETMGYGRGSMMGMGPMMGHQGMGMPMMGANIYSYLDLTAEQKQKIREIMKESRQASRKARDDIEDYAEQLADLYSAEPPDAKAIGEVYDKIFAAKRTVIDQSLAARAKISALLTDEQKKQLKELRAHRAPGRHMMMR